MAADDLLELLSDELIDQIGQLALARHLPSALRLGETCKDLRRRLQAVLLAAEVLAVGRSFRVYAQASLLSLSAGLCSYEL